MNRTEQPAISHAYNTQLIIPGKRMLSNGVEIYYIEGGKQDVCRIDVLYKAGNIFEDKNLVSSSANDLMGEGTNHKTSLEVNEAFDFYGAHIQRESSRDYAGVSLFASDKHLEFLLPVLMEVILESNYAEHEFDLYLKNRRARFEDSSKKVEFVCRNEFTGLLYGKHPYGKPVSKDDFNNVSRDELFSFYQKLYKEQLPVIFVTGVVSDDSKKRMEHVFSAFTGNHRVFPDMVFAAPVKGKTFMEMEGAIQSAIRIGRPMITIEHPDYPALSVANTLLGGYFGSRLMKNIREEKGLTYGIGSGLVSFEKNGMWMVGTEVGKEVTEQALEEIYKEMAILCTEPVKEQELEVVKNYVLGNYIKSIDGAFAQSEKIKNMVLRKLDPEFYTRQIEQIQRITPEEIQVAAAKYFDPAELSELVVGSK